MTQFFKINQIFKQNFQKKNLNLKNDILNNSIVTEECFNDCGIFHGFLYLDSYPTIYN